MSFPFLLLFAVVFGIGIGLALCVLIGGVYTVVQFLLDLCHPKKP